MTDYSEIARRAKLNATGRDADDDPDDDGPSHEGLAGPTPEDRPKPEGRRNKQGIRIDPDVEAARDPRRAVISVLVTHEPGVLSEVSALFSRRQFNIESLTVGATSDPDRARITVVTEEPDPGIDQLEKQLRKLIPVISVRELDPDAVRRELAIVKVDAESPSEVAAVADMYDARTIDASPETVTVEVTGSRQKIEGAIETFEQFGIREITRTGTAAQARGTDTTAETPPSTTTGRTEAAAAATDGGEPVDDDTGPVDGRSDPFDDQHDDQRQHRQHEQDADTEQS